MWVNGQRGAQAKFAVEQANEDGELNKQGRWMKMRQREAVCRATAKRAKRGRVKRKQTRVKFAEIQKETDWESEEI